MANEGPRRRGPECGSKMSLNVCSWRGILDPLEIIYTILFIFRAKRKSIAFIEFPERSRTQKRLLGRPRTGP
jgi:hypothetical protein